MCFLLPCVKFDQGSKKHILCVDGRGKRKIASENLLKVSNKRLIWYFEKYKNICISLWQGVIVGAKNFQRILTVN